MFDPNQKDALINAITIRKIRRRHIVIGTLSEKQLAVFNSIREEKEWPHRESNDVIVGNRDIYHMLKRIDKDNLTPTEVVSIIEHALSDNSIVSRGDNLRPVLTNLEHMEIDGNTFGAKAIFLDSRNAPFSRLFGVIPVGWWGRRKK